MSHGLRAQTQRAHRCRGGQLFWSSNGGAANLRKRHRGDSSPCGQSPMDFESISLATRTQCLCTANSAVDIYMSKMGPGAKNQRQTNWHGSRQQVACLPPSCVRHRRMERGCQQRSLCHLGDTQSSWASPLSWASWRLVPEKYLARRLLSFFRFWGCRGCLMWEATMRRRGGIKPLHVSMPRELKSRPNTSPTHSGPCPIPQHRAGCAPWSSVTKCARHASMKKVF